MQADKKAILDRLASAEGHLEGIRKMIEDDAYCIDVLKQTYAVQRALDKMQAVILRAHLGGCVPDRMADDSQRDRLITELTDLYEIARK